MGKNLVRKKFNFSSPTGSISSTHDPCNPGHNELDNVPYGNSTRRFDLTSGQIGAGKKLPSEVHSGVDVEHPLIKNTSAAVDRATIRLPSPADTLAEKPADRFWVGLVRISLWDEDGYWDKILASLELRSARPRLDVG